MEGGYPPYNTPLGSLGVVTLRSPTVLSRIHSVVWQENCWISYFRGTCTKKACTLFTSFLQYVYSEHQFENMRFNISVSLLWNSSTALLGLSDWRYSRGRSQSSLNNLVVIQFVTSKSPYLIWSRRGSCRGPLQCGRLSWHPRTRDKEEKRLQSLDCWWDMCGAAEHLGYW